MTAARKAASSRKQGDDAEQNETGGFRVVAPLVQVQIGDRVFQYVEGAVLPNGVNEDNLEHLKSLGFVTDEPQQ